METNMQMPPPSQNPVQHHKMGEPLNKNLALICATVVVICLIVSGAVLYSRNSTGNNTNIIGNNNVPTDQQPNQVAADISKVNISGNPFVGSINAPVVVAFWSDYQCPFCKKTEQGPLTQIYDEYVKTGKAKIVFKDYAFLGADSQTASWMARAVWAVAPDKFYVWNKTMFEKQDAENGGWGTRADILAMTKSLGIDSAKVDALVTSNVQEYQKAIDADKAEGTAFGITGTPGTIIGKQMIIGAQDYPAFKAAIDQVLSGK